MLALDLTWAQQDILALKWEQLDDDSSARGKRIKTNVTMFPALAPQAAPASPRYASARRSGRPTSVPRPRTAATWSARRSTTSPGRRTTSATPSPWCATSPAPAPYGLGNNGIREKQFRDLRDTAVTRLDALGISDKMIATRSGHQFGSVQRTLGKHYSERERIAKAANQFIADRMGEAG